MMKGFTRFLLKKSPQKGFSLIELSVVISVAATVTVGFLAWTQPAATTNATKAVKTKERMQEISDAIESFRVKQGRLPCPADPTMREDNTKVTGTNTYDNDFGMENLDTVQDPIDGVTTLGVDCPNSIGAVPVHSLELGTEYMEDAWGRRFIYHVSPNLCGIDAGVSATIDAATSQITGCTAMDYSNHVGNITINDTLRDLTNTAAFVLVSMGANGYGAYLPSGTTKESTGASANELENLDGDTTYIKTDTGTDFDDIVLFQTRVQLEHLTTNTNQKLLSIAECNANSTAISGISFSTTGELNDHLTDSRLGAGVTGDQVALGVLLAIQRTCTKYYWDATTGAAKSYKGETWDGPKCPGTATYVPATESCSCATGNWDSCS